ncbi:hypothetical protein [Ktedonospora formicarum]|uniref:hypothetical protein n=1 Tax=Ktedonospora formicarum TaxID=2778364 RepID=UPI001C68EA3B|nr:hypothetical protein [Ktedonospora formicarum]
MVRQLKQQTIIPINPLIHLYFDETLLDEGFDLFVGAPVTTLSPALPLIFPASGWLEKNKSHMCCIGGVRQDQGSVCGPGSLVGDQWIPPTRLVLRLHQQIDNTLIPQLAQRMKHS